MFWTKASRRAGLAAALLTLLAPTTATIAQDTPFYSGKSIEVIVPAGPGGGTDTFARLVARFYTGHIPGNPTMIIQNIPGGGTLLGANEFANAPVDGSVIFSSTASTHLPYMLGSSGVHYEIRDWRPVFGSGVGGAVYARADALSGIEDLASLTQQLNFAGENPEGLTLIALLSLELLGVDHLAILGYPSGGEMAIAVERGEADISYATTQVYQNQIESLTESGTTVPLYSFGIIDATGELVRDPVIADIPTVAEVYEQLHGEAPSGTLWEAYRAFVSAAFSIQKIFWIHKQAPEEAYQALLQGAQALVNDDAFNEAAAEALGGYPVYIGDEAETALLSALEMPAEAREWVLNYLTERFDLRYQERN